MRISSPPVKWPCFYGIDFATRAELIANGRTVDEIRSSIGADSLGYISLEGLIEATEPRGEEPVPRLLRRRVPDRPARARAARQAPAGGRGGGRTVSAPSDAADAAAAHSAGATYAAAGVDVEAGERAVELMRSAIARAQRPEVVGGFGGFAGLFDASALTRFRRPLLATSTDGVGTKVDVARRMDVHDTIGIDLVAMVVDDLVVCGAEPLFMTDYIACGRVVPERIAAIVTGIAEGCRRAGVRAGRRRDRRAPRPARRPTSTTSPAPAPAWSRPTSCSARIGCASGDVLVAMASSGLHSNGYSLARHVLFDRAGWALDRHVARAGPHPRRGAARADPDLRPRLPGPDLRAAGCTRSRTSPAAGSPPTSPGSCPAECTARSTGRPGPRRRSSA